MIRVLVCGGRNFNDYDLVDRVMTRLNEERGISAVIEGGARGADMAAYTWAKKNGLHEKTYPADWTTYGKSAGLIRNAQMLRDGNPDLVVAFPGGNGTAHMMALARRHAVEVLDVSAGEDLT